MDFSAGPLDGLRIVDLTSIIMGPFATRILGDYGADVIKVEPLGGDSTRFYRPSRSGDMSGTSLNLNRNKRSITLDLKHPSGKDVLEKIVKSADVLIHSMRPKAIARLGFGYDRVRALNPDIVYCGAYGFGADGPYADMPAYDDTIQAASGISALYERMNGAPAYIPTVLCDKLAGQAIAHGVLAALVQRFRGGGGQAVEVPMFETAVEFFLIEHLVGATFEPPLGEAGYGRLLTAFRRPYRVRDGYAAVVPYTDKNWSDIFDFAGRPGILQNPKFRTLPDRVENIEELYSLLTELVRAYTLKELKEVCEANQIPFMPVMSFDDVMADEHIKAVGMFTTAVHPSEGAYRSVRQPIRFSGSKFAIRRYAPKLGENFGEILSELGYGPDEIAKLGERHLPGNGGAATAGEDASALMERQA